MQNTSLRRTARRRAAAKSGFIVHFAVFVAVNALLYLVNQRTSPGIAWFAFPLGGWAIGLTVHGLAVALSGSGLRERMIDAELRNLEARNGPGAR